MTSSPCSGPRRISDFSQYKRRLVVALAYPPGGAVCFLQISSAPFVVIMYNYHPRLFAKSNIEKQYFSHRVNDVCNGSPSRILRVLRISFGMTILPKSSTRRTMPVAFISSSPLKRKSAGFSGRSICRKRGIMYDGEQQCVTHRMKFLRLPVATVGTPSVIRRPCLQNTCPFNPPYPERAH